MEQGTGQDILLHPADDQIARFVKELDRGSVIHAIVTDAAGKLLGCIGPRDIMSVTIPAEAKEIETV